MKPLEKANLNRENTECYTYKYGVYPILPYIKPYTKVWCPCDTKESNFVKVLTENCTAVRYSDIKNDSDIFKVNFSEGVDYIITNPPFKNKAKFVERIMSFNKPFMILLPWNCLGDNGIVNLFLKQNKEIQLLIPNKRMEFGNQPNKGISFKCIYVCWNVLPKQIIFCEIDTKGDK